ICTPDCTPCCAHEGVCQWQVTISHSGEASTGGGARSRWVATRSPLPFPCARESSTKHVYDHLVWLLKSRSYAWFMVSADRRSIPPRLKKIFSDALRWQLDRVLQDQLASGANPASHAAVNLAHAEVYRIFARRDARFTANDDERL